MSGTIRARTAGKPHHCAKCTYDFTIPRGKPTIHPGHRYLLVTDFPNDVIPFITSHRECVACLVDAGNDWLISACQGYCCATEPCARPMRHDGQHSCRRCAGQAAAGGQDGVR